MATIEGTGLGAPGALSRGRRLSRKPLPGRWLPTSTDVWTSALGVAADVSEASNGFPAVGVSSELSACADRGVAASRWIGSVDPVRPCAGPCTPSVRDVTLKRSPSGTKTQRQRRRGSGSDHVKGSLAPIGAPRSVLHSDDGLGKRRFPLFRHVEFLSAYSVSSFNRLSNASNRWTHSCFSFATHCSISSMPSGFRE